MPICKKCGDAFPNRTRIDGRVRLIAGRRCCLKCLPFGHRDRVSTEHRACQSCSRVYVYDRKKGHTATKCNSCNANGNRVAVKRRAIDYKGGSCSRCGYNKCPDSLVFHHLDPKGKDFTMAGGWALSWDRLEDELDKCILLCANCHGEVHAEMRNII